jgi:hypothetical protein
MSTKKMSKKKTTPAAEKKPEAIERDDLLILQIAAKSSENTALKLQLAQVNVEKLQVEKQQMDTQMQRLNLQVNEKYKLVPGTDKLDINTGTISRG